MGTVTNTISAADLSLAEIEKLSVCDTKNVRVFITGGIDLSSAFYSPSSDETKMATVVYDTEKNSITITTQEEDGRAAKAAMKLWGEDIIADGPSAGSPEGIDLAEKDIIKAVKAVEAELDPAKDRRIEERVGIVKERLRERSISKRMKTVKSVHNSVSGRMKPQEAAQPLPDPAEEQTAGNNEPIPDEAAELPEEAPAQEEDGEKQNANRQTVIEQAEVFPGVQPETEEEKFDMLEENGLAFLNDDVAVFVTGNASDLINGENMDPADAQKLRKYIMDIAPVKYDENKLEAVTNIFIIEPVKNTSNINLYRFSADGIAKETLRNTGNTSEKEKEKNADKPSLRERMSKGLVCIKENIALGAAVGMIISRGGPVKTMGEAQEAEEMRAGIKEKLGKVRGALGLDKEIKEEAVR